jgi:hypothetical protein
VSSCRDSHRDSEWIQIRCYGIFAAEARTIRELARIVDLLDLSESLLVEEHLCRLLLMF